MDSVAGDLTLALGNPRRRRVTSALSFWKTVPHEEDTYPCETSKPHGDVPAVFSRALQKGRRYKFPFSLVSPWIWG